MEAQIKALEVDVVRLEEEVQSKLNTIGNIVHDSVKVSNNEDDNPVVRTWGEHVPQPKFLHHYDVLAKLDAYDAERGNSYLLFLSVVLISHRYQSGRTQRIFPTRSRIPSQPSAYQLWY